MLKKLRNQKEEEARKKSLEIKDKLFRLSIFRQAKTVMFYLADVYEVQTRAMIEGALKLGKTIAVPACDIKTKKIRPSLLSSLALRKLKKGPYGIDEPSSLKPVKLREIDLVIVPGLAFDKKGNRLGRGMGYYDRFLSRLSRDVPKIGLAFRFQVCKDLANWLPHDVPVDRILFA